LSELHILQVSVSSRLFFFLSKLRLFVFSFIHDQDVH
jgi:hypothetical protein